MCRTTKATHTGRFGGSGQTTWPAALGGGPRRALRGEVLAKQREGRGASRRGNWGHLRPWPGGGQEQSLLLGGLGQQGQLAPAPEARTSLTVHPPSTLGIHPPDSGAMQRVHPKPTVQSEESLRNGAE